MPYQERQAGERIGPADSAPPTLQAQEQPGNARTVQIIIVVGLIAAIVVAIFGSY